MGTEFALEPHDAFVHPQVVELDAVPLGALLRVPVLRLEAVLGTPRFGTEQAIVTVETVEHRPGNFIRLRRIESLREHRVCVHLWWLY